MHTQAAERRISSLKKMAWACAALVLAITTLSAFIRLSTAGLGCEPWPQCYGEAWRAAAEGLSLVPAAGVSAARIAHRLLAVASLLLIIAMLMSAYSKQPVLRREGRMVLGLLALALFLAILGRFTAGTRVPAVTLGNLLGGFAMFALSCRLAITMGRKPAAASTRGRLVYWARFGAALLALQISLGGSVSAGHAGLSCPHLAGCETAAGSWQVLNPWHVAPMDQSDLTHPAGSVLHAVHRAGMWVLAAVLLPLGIAFWRSGYRAGAWLIGLLALQAALGVGLILGGLPLAVALAHNVVAALLLAVLVWLAHPQVSRGQPI